MVGRPKKVPDEKILRILDESKDPVMTAREIADELGESRRTIHHRLDELHEGGQVEKKAVGGRSVVWWLAREDDSTIHDSRGRQN